MKKREGDVFLERKKEEKYTPQQFWEEIAQPVVEKFFSAKKEPIRELSLLDREKPKEKASRRLKEVFFEIIEKADCQEIIPLSFAPEKLKHLFWYPIIDQKLELCFLVREGGTHSYLLGFLVFLHYLKGDICLKDQGGYIQSTLKKMLKAIIDKNEDKENILTTMSKLDDAFLSNNCGCYFSSAKIWFMSKEYKLTFLEGEIISTEKFPIHKEEY